MTNIPRPDATPLFAVLVMVFLLATGAMYLARPLHRPSIEPAALDHHINVNSADAPTLRLLPGIGPMIAHRIVEHRQRAGPFQSPADLEKVKHIGPHTRRRIEPFVRFGTVRRPDDKGSGGPCEGSGGATAHGAQRRESGPWAWGRGGAGGAPINSEALSNQFAGGGALGEQFDGAVPTARPSKRPRW